MRFFTQLLVVLALVTAGISPACAFAGRSDAMPMMEICGADGGVRLVPVPAELRSLLVDAGDQGDESDLLGSSGVVDVAALDTMLMGDNCQFCLFQSAGKVVAQISTPFHVPDTKAASLFARDGPVAGYDSTQGFSPRAPPVYS